MKDGLGNETIFAFPEIFPDATEWAASETPLEGNITVNAQRFREILNLVGDAWPVAMSLMLIKGGQEKDAEGMYGKSTDAAAMASMLNRISAVWCEGDLIVSGLFVDSQGNPLVSENQD